MIDATKSSLADFHLRVKMALGVLLLAAVSILPPIEIVMVGSVGLILAQLLQGQLLHILFNTVAKVPPSQTSPLAKRPQAAPLAGRDAPHSHSGARARAAPSPHPGIMLEADAASLDTAVSAACVSLAAAQRRAGGKSLPPPVACDVALAKLDAGLLGGPPSSSSVVELVTSVINASLPFARVYDAGEAGAGLELVVVADSAALTSHLRDRLRRGVRVGERLPLASSKLQKSALRYCINLLVAKGFKFRRSAFKADEPAVSLNAPEALSGKGGAINVNLSVNNLMPLLNGALVYEAAAVDPRALPLITSVHRWTEARGLAHASFGPLSMYAWTHFVIYFLQSAVEPSMPPLCGDQAKVAVGMPDAALLVSFFEFCASFAWGEKSIVIQGLNNSSKANQKASESPKDTAILLEDFFRKGFELGTHLRTAQYVERLRCEARLAARKLASPEATVASLLERPAFVGVGSHAPPPGLGFEADGSDEPQELPEAPLIQMPTKPEVKSEFAPNPSSIPPWRLRAG